jgi:multicomponent Na+:H+ antiporter subunit E
MKKLYALLKLALFYGKALCLSHWQVLSLVLKPKVSVSPSLIEHQTTIESRLGRLLLANLITLTPGTMSLDFEADQKTLLVHSLFGDDQGLVSQDIQRFDQLMGAVFK